MLADVSGLSLKDFSTGYWAFAERFFACEIDFRVWFFGFSFFLRFWVALLEFESDTFLIIQNEKRFERPAFARNEPFQQIRFAGREQLLHLFLLDRPL